MRVVCENCGATYKIPESKLVKEVNKATCRKCGFRMMIRRPSATAVSDASAGNPNEEPDAAVTQITANPLERQDSEAGLLEAETRIAPGAVNEWNEDSPTNVQVDPTVPPAAGSGAAPNAAPPKATPPKAAPPMARPSAPSGRADSDMILALVATFASAGGAMLLATNTADESTQRMLGLGIALWGALTCLFLLVTGNLWRQKGNLPISIALATVLSIGGSTFVEVALYGDSAPDADAVAQPEPPPAPEAAATGPDDAIEDANKVDDATDDDAADALANDGSMEIGNPGDVDSSETRNEPKPPPAAAPPAQNREAPVDDSESLDDPDIDAVAAAAVPVETADERRRQEMEAAAEARVAERTRRDREAARKAEADRLAKERDRAEKSRPVAKAPEAQSGSKMNTLPLTVVDTMIRSNMSVKRCFFNEKQESGEMPRRVNVRFTVLNSGRVSSARITTDRYKGGTLDSCLGRAFKAIQFPPFQGEAKSMTYPFVL